MTPAGKRLGRKERFSSYSFSCSCSCSIPKMRTYFDHEKLNAPGLTDAVCELEWVAHASRPASEAGAPSQSRTFPLFTNSQTMAHVGEACFGATPKPAREPRALPIIVREEADSSFRFEHEQEQEKE